MELILAEIIIVKRYGRTSAISN
jgi:hypothetical protein